jgi:bifunctional DNA-binding transcriptional regulator/antitoxin component of YhaV-PrlF toxin-antitoxin module
VTARRFRAVVGEASRGAGRWVEVPFDVRASFGEARPPVAGTVAGVPYRSRLAVYGGRTYLGLTREVRDAAGIDVGDEIEVVLDRDDAPREVSVPAELETVLSGSPSARAYYEGLAFTHRREYAQWVGEAKRPETRSRRAARAVEMLLEGVKHP